MDKALLSSLKLVAAYAVAGGLWIGLSDQALQELVMGDAEAFSRLQSYKGWAFIGVTALLLFALSHHFLRQIIALQELDPQTNLLHHALFLSHLDDVLEGADGSVRPVLVMFLDIDDFNDLTTRETADEFITQLGGALRSQHSADTLLSRLGRDEFAIAVPLSPAERTSHPRHATHLREVFRQVASEADLELSCSIGAALSPEDGKRATDLLAAAGKALRVGRQRGQGQLSYFNERLERQEKEQRTLLQDLRRAIENGELAVHYQPQVHLIEQRLSGCEVLVRWNSPERGQVSPDRFIPLAEEYRLTNLITEQVVQKASKELHERKLLGTVVPRVSVNISAEEFTHRHFLQHIGKLLEAHRELQPHLQLEITERMALLDMARSIAHVSALREQGLSVSVDDFGTGYSGLAMLRDLPVDELKIDRSFVVDLNTQERSAVIVHSITRFAKSFGLTVVAEGVETAEQLQALIQCDCTEAQGYLIAPPLDIDAFSAFLERPPIWLANGGIASGDSVR